MAKVYLIYVQVATALALFKYSLADWNATEELANRTVSHCHHHSNGDNCTVATMSPRGQRSFTACHSKRISGKCVAREDSVDDDTWHGHFSKCPEELTGYCVHGDCRYIEDQNAPSCRCERGFVGSRCEYLELDWWRGEKQGILIICIIAGLVLLILLILFTCLCSNRRCRTRWQRRRRREVPTNGTEKLSMMDAAGSRPALSSDPTEPRRINTV